MNKLILTVAGAATLLISTVVLIDYAARKASNKKANAGELLVGIAGAAAGAAVALYAQKSSDKKDLVIEDMLDEEDLALMQENISEVLGAATEHSQKPEKLRTIEVDEETSIEDFI